MYVAQRHLKVQEGVDPQGKAIIRTIEPGEAIPDAVKWPQSVLVAHLNLEWLKWVSDERDPTKFDRQVVDMAHYRGEKQNSPEGVTKTASEPESPRSTPEAGVDQPTELLPSEGAASEVGAVVTPTEDTATRDAVAKNDGAKAAATASPRLSRRERREQQKKKQRGA